MKILTLSFLIFVLCAVPALLSQEGHKKKVSKKVAHQSARDHTETLDHIHSDGIHAKSHNKENGPAKQNVLAGPRNEQRPPKRNGNPRNEKHEKEEKNNHKKGLHKKGPPSQRRLSHKKTVTKPNRSTRAPRQ